MPIICVGINHHSAHLPMRERLAFSDDAARAAQAAFSQIEQHKAAQAELIILSTCNRVELYAALPEANFNLLENYWLNNCGISEQDLRSEILPHVYHLSDQETVDHLFRVAAGLDSLVLGEPQILGQVTRALESARHAGSAGPVLSRLFQSAVHAGKRVRTETSIARSPASISSVAVRLAADVFPRLESTQVSVLGAGEMAELVVESLRKRGVIHFQVINRSLEHAQNLAIKYGGQALSLEQLGSALEHTDILVASASAPVPLIGVELASAIMASRRDHPLVIIDIAVPRNVDPEVRKIAGIQVYDMDDLQAYLAQALVSRAQQMPAAQAILEEENLSFGEFLNQMELLPLIKELRLQMESIRLGELEKTLRHLPDLSTEQRKHIEAMTQALVKKMLHAPISRLRSEAGCPNRTQYTFVTRSLFGLEDQPSDCRTCYFSSKPASYSNPQNPEP